MMHGMRMRVLQKIHPSPRPCVAFHNKLVSYGEECLSPCPTPRLDDNSLLPVLTAYSIYLQLLSFIQNLRMCHCVVLKTKIIGKIRMEI
jgi:hypothetical protein